MAEKGKPKPRPRPAREAARTYEGGYELRVLKGADAGSSLKLSGTRLVLGRAPSCDAVLHDEAIADEHLHAVFAEGVLTLLGNQSTDEQDGHPVWVNGVRIAAFPQDVRAGDYVQIGQSILAIGAREEDWPPDDALALMPLPQAGDASAPAEARTRHKLRAGLFGAVGLGGLAFLILVAALLRQGSLALRAPELALEDARSQLDFALRTDAAFMHVHAQPVGGRVVLGGLVGEEEDFVRLKALAEKAQFDFAVENGAMVASMLGDALSARLPHIHVHASLKGERQLHIALEGRVAAMEDARELARTTAEQLAEQEQWPNLTLSFMLEDYDELLLQVRDALDEEPGLDGVMLKPNQDLLRLEGALLTPYAETLQAILLRTLGEEDVQSLVEQAQTLVPPPRGRLLGIAADASHLRYQDADGAEEEIGVGAQLEEQWQVQRIEADGVWLQYEGHEALWPNPQAARRRVDLDVLQQSLQAALDADSIFGELELIRKPNRVILRGGLVRVGEARLEEILKSVTGNVRARHRLLLRITQVPEPEGEVVTIFDGATKAVRMRREAGQERLIKIGELLGNGLKLTDIVDGTVQVQFGDVHARLQVGGAAP